jgi:hypothetical protein
MARASRATQVGVGLAYENSLAMRMSKAFIAISLFGSCALAQQVTPSCKTSPNVVGACFAVQGRLFATEGRPRIRIQTSDQSLGVYDRQFRLESEELVPKAVATLLERGPRTIAVDGDYLVCPFEKDASSAMRMVCIESADHLVARPRDENKTGARP